MQSRGSIEFRFSESIWSRIVTRGGALTPHLGRYVPRQSENGELRSELERVNLNT